MLLPHPKLSVNYPVKKKICIIAANKSLEITYLCWIVDIRLGELHPQISLRVGHKSSSETLELKPHKKPNFCKNMTHKEEDCSKTYHLEQPSVAEQLRNLRGQSASALQKQQQ